MLKLVLELLILCVTLVVTDYYITGSQGHRYGSYRSIEECSPEERPCGSFEDFGVCRTGGCRQNERVSKFGKDDCQGTDCQCCKLQTECSFKERPCGSYGDFGVCRTGGCRQNERVCKLSKEDCPGTDCQCCKPQTECKKEEKLCGAPGEAGKCRTGECYLDESACPFSKDDCLGTDCQCCKPRNETGCRNKLSWCGKIGDVGVCRTEGCRSNEWANKNSKLQCPGADCECCKPKYNKALRWSKATLGCVKDHNNKVLLEISSLGVCKSLCEIEQEFSCRSIDYSPSNWECDLSTEDRTSGSYKEPCDHPWETTIFTEIIADGECPSIGRQCGQPGDLGFCRTGGCELNEYECKQSKTQCKGADCVCCKPYKDMIPEMDRGCKSVGRECGQSGDIGICRTSECRPNEHECKQSKSECTGADCVCCKPNRDEMPARGLRWSVASLGCILGHNNRILHDIHTLEACKKECERETGFLCRSIDYLPTTGECDLSTSDRASKSYKQPCKRPWEKTLYAEIISG